MDPPNVSLLSQPFWHAFFNMFLAGTIKVSLGNLSKFWRSGKHYIMKLYYMSGNWVILWNIRHIFQFSSISGSPDDGEWDSVCLQDWAFYDINRKYFQSKERLLPCASYMALSMDCSHAIEKWKFITMKYLGDL